MPRLFFLPEQGRVHKYIVLLLQEYVQIDETTEGCNEHDVLHIARKAA